MKLIYIVFTLVALVSAETPDVPNNILPEDLRTYVNVRKALEDLIPWLSQRIIENNLDPYSLDNIQREFWVPFPGIPLISYKANLILHSGELKGLSQLRFTDATLTYENRMITLAIDTEFPLFAPLSKRKRKRDVERMCISVCSLRSLSVYTVEHTAILDKAFDRLLPQLQAFILEHGMDPMELADVSDRLLPNLPGILGGHIDLKSGWLQNLSKLKRADHVVARYSEQKLTLDMDLGFDVLDFNYQYDIQYMLFSRQGDIYGRFYRLKLKVVLTIDFAERYISLNSIKFVVVGKYDIKFEGHILDSILNLATKAVTTIFKKDVLAHIERRAMQIFGAKIDEWNKLIWPPSNEELATPAEMTYDFDTFGIDTFDVKLDTLDFKLD
ncbi:hypothetical protein EAI_16713 [Harpegnathos saltator]|uniref:Uncharacterized protein n=1 Tax=Harpegnathos saltator TaxID=610380 RepID=E2BMP4_HARSA|nr:hypothetical protein EAI_16713 [Harpegnathos saltator]